MLTPTTTTNTAVANIDASANLKKNTDTEKLEKNIESIISGSLPYYKSIFKQMLLANPQNANTLYNFLLAEQNEMNVKLGTNTTNIKIIHIFNRFLDFKDFHKITKQDIQCYLSSLRRSEAEDKTHK